MTLEQLKQLLQSLPPSQYQTLGRTMIASYNQTATGRKFTCVEEVLAA